MITAFDLCTPHAGAPPAHHSQAPAPSRAPRTRIVYVRLAPYAHLENACTKATGPLLAILETPVEDSYAPALAPMGDLRAAVDMPGLQAPSGRPVVMIPWTPPRPQPASAVPEPSTWTLLLLGFGAVGARLRGRRSAAAAAP